MRSGFFTSSSTGSSLLLGVVEEADVFLAFFHCFLRRLFVRDRTLSMMIIAIATSASPTATPTRIGSNEFSAKLLISEPNEIAIENTATQFYGLCSLNVPRTI